MSTFGVIVVSLLISVTMVTTLENPLHPQINTTSGLLVGTTLEQAHAFYSVPYAEEPIRFMPPVPISYRGDVNASLPNYVMCTQSESYQKYKFAKYQDDCLVLNIHVPSSVNLNQVQSSDFLPVMVWIPGGAFFFRAGTFPELDGQFLSNSTNSVIVTINYRLDVLGFFAYEEGNVKYEGNQGLKDQQLALKWVQDNIFQFGGDKNQVTIFANSAGAQSVTLHLLSDVSDPLFNRAIIESNPAWITYPTPEETKPVIQALTEVLNCSGSTIDCLTTTNSMDIVNALPTVLLKLQSTSIFELAEPYRPVIDGVEFIDQPLNLFRDGKWQKHKEVIIGTNTMESADVFFSLDETTLNQESFKEQSISSFGPYYGLLGADEYLKYANESDPNFDYKDLLILEATDLYFTCPSRALARYMANTSSLQKNSSIYLYEFAHTASADCLNISGSADLCQYAYHASEIVFVFNTGSSLGYTNTENDLKVINQLSSFWGAFAHSGSPSADQNIWPSYNKQAQGNIDAWTNVVIKAPTSSLKTRYRQSQCDFWDSVGYLMDPLTPAPTSTSGIPATTAPTSTSGIPATTAPTSTSGIPATIADTSEIDEVTLTVITTSGTCSTIISGAVNFVLVMMMFVVTLMR